MIKKNDTKEYIAIIIAIISILIVIVSYSEAKFASSESQKILHEQLNKEKSDRQNDMKEIRLKIDDISRMITEIWKAFKK